MLKAQCNAEGKLPTIRLITLELTWVIICAFGLHSNNEQT